MSPPDARNAPASGPNTGQPYRSYLYDLAGNQMMSCSGTITGSTCSGESLTYIYDGKDQLRRATTRDSSGNTPGSEEYWYDGRGTRITTLKRDSVAQDLPNPLGPTHHAKLAVDIQNLGNLLDNKCERASTPPFPGVMTAVDLARDHRTVHIEPPQSRPEPGPCARVGVEDVDGLMYDF